MVGYNLYLIYPDEIDLFTGEVIATGEEVYLHLCYSSHSEATKAKEILETVYGEGRIEIDTRTLERSLTE